jgi:class 3 adenylate cyclase
MMPIEIIKQLKMGKAIAEPYSEVTVLFCEIYHFSTFASQHPPDVVVRTLNTVYSRFDDLIDEFGVHKVETVFEVYMVVGGCPVRADDHCAKVCDMALAMMAAWKVIQQDLKSELGIPGVLCVCFQCAISVLEWWFGVDMHAQKPSCRFVSASTLARS